MRRTLPIFALVIGGVGCGKNNGGPGLPSCSRPPTAAGCTATWTGTVAGSNSCTQLSWGTATGWSFTLDGPNANQLTVGALLPAAPAAGQSFTMDQLGGFPLIQLNVGTDWWGATPTIGGEMLLQVDQVVPGSAYIHGSLAGSLVKGSGGSDQGVQICITF